MTFRTLLLRSLRFHWRAHLGVGLGAAVGSAALIGALVLGDSVKQSLKQRALDRIADFTIALNSHDRFFTIGLVERMFAVASNRTAFVSFGRTNWGPIWNAGVERKLMLSLSAATSRQDNAARANRIHLFGVKASALGRSILPVYPPGHPGRGQIWLSQGLAEQLSVEPGDELVVRIEKPSALSAEAAIQGRNDSVVVRRFSVGGVVRPFWENLSFENGAVPPLNAFLQYEELASALGLEGKLNMILSANAIHLRPASFMDRLKYYRDYTPIGWKWVIWGESLTSRAGSEAETLDIVNQALNEAFRLEDAELELVSSRLGDMLELRTERIFLDSTLARAALAADTNAQPILTYLATLLRAGTNATPYSMVTAAGAPWTLADLRDDEILVSQWLAEDLQVKPGDEIALSYFLPESGAKLTEATNTFRVRAVVPMEMPWADRTLMPDFPGIEKAESTSDWDAGFPLTYKIRQKDEDYWKKYRGTPKAFITLAAGQKMWGNRFGNLTAIRFPVPINLVGTLSTASQTSPKDGDAVERIPTDMVEYRAALEKKILASLKPEELGLRFEPVREQALKAAEESQDFGGLFLGFSFFVIAAALLLMALLFSLGLEQRAPEIGTLLALGFTPRQVQRLLLCEGAALSFLGGILGALGGLAYAKAMLQGLTTIWRDAVGASALSLHFTGQTLIIGLFASVVVSVATIWLTLRKFVRRTARELLVGEIDADESKVQSPKSKVFAVAALLMALGLVGWAVASGETSNAGVFFGAGALVLVAGLAAANARLIRLGGLDASTLTPALSPREKRESHSPISGEIETAERSETPRKSASGRSLLPFPAGEGQGEGERAEMFSLSALGLRGCARRRKRSLATVAMLACGSFLIVSIGVFRLDANRDAWKKTSGTGGFALIGETTMPMVHDLNSQSGRDFYALNERDLKGVSFVPFRVREGDEASCLNLNRAQRPRLLGVKPEMLEGRFAIAKGAGWQTLINTPLQRGASTTNEPENRLNGFSETRPYNTGLKPGVSEIEIPAIGDANSIQWAMHKKVGDTIDYVDERGQPFKVRIVGAVANSILQGQLIIDEAEFVKRFPGESGYRMFLIDAPSNSVPQVSATLSRAMQDVGLELTPAAERLAQFNAVQNTYLGTFQVLGGLGLLLGSVGLGIVVLRNVLERRGELAVLLAVGFRKPQLQRLLLIENGALLAVGLALGVAAAAVAVLPALLSPSAQLPYASLVATLSAVLVNGALWTWAATRLAVRGDLLKALRNE